MEELATRCRHIETLGLVPSTSLAIFHWDWLEDLACIPPQLHNALSLYELYHHTQSGEIVGHFNHRVSMLLRFVTIYREAGTWRIHLPTDTDENWISDYHGIQRNGYVPVRFVEPSHTGICGQPRAQLLALLEAIQLPHDLHEQASKLVSEFHTMQKRTKSSQR